ncbi:hypothetical protein ACFQ88_21185 [Paenibacillus sp. NPDC056579]|uniref:hypothetical protein n=1 Tax=Paenibacillus sp. NPDC056579 TaxID=3345871 RepID=UPI00368B9C27
MSFQYGSNAPDIKNPFKKEGLLYVASGIAILLIGITALFVLRSQIAGQAQSAGWIHLIICIVLLLGGGGYLTRGLLKMFRFYVGRGIPASLSKNEARSEKHVAEPNIAYHVNTLDQMLSGRKNVTFHEPVTLLDRMLYSIYPNFIFLPYSMRNYLHLVVQNAGYSIIALLIYFLSLLSGSLGLTKLSSTSFSGWLGIALLAGLSVLWVVNLLSVKRVNHPRLFRGSRLGIVWMTISAVLLPAVGELLLRQGIEPPAAPFNPTLPLILLFLFIPALTAAAIVLAKYRSDLYDPVTEVSEFREHWQENVHPKDFFRSLDMEFANIRYKEFPNRVYRELSPNLQMEGSMDKGSFVGDTIQETQPMYKEISEPPSSKHVRLYTAIAGHALVVLSALLLFVLNKQFSGDLTFQSLFNGVYFPGLLFLFGSSALTLAHIYWAEMHFTSYLIQFQGEGTYTESKISVGMAITDSTRSENTIVRTSFSPWLLVTKLVTSTQASSGSGNLSGPRYIMSMHKADDMMDHLTEKMKAFLGNRETIATALSPKDLQSMQTMFTINEAAPSKEQLRGSEGSSINKIAGGAERNSDENE